MFRPHRPAIEKLEKREFCWAGPVTLQPLLTPIEDVCSLQVDNSEGQPAIDPKAAQPLNLSGTGMFGIGAVVSEAVQSLLCDGSVRGIQSRSLQDSVHAAAMAQLDADDGAQSSLIGIAFDRDVQFYGTGVYRQTAMQTGSSAILDAGTGLADSMAIPSQSRSSALWLDIGHPSILIGLLIP
jgi:hypothetical protein